MTTIEKDLQASLQTAFKLIQQSDVVVSGARQGPPRRKQAASSENCTGRSVGPTGDPTLFPVRRQSLGKTSLRPGFPNGLQSYLARMYIS